MLLINLKSKHKQILTTGYIQMNLKRPQKQHNYVLIWFSIIDILYSSLELSYAELKRKVENRKSGEHGSQEPA